MTLEEFKSFMRDRYPHKFFIGYKECKQHKILRCDICIIQIYEAHKQLENLFGVKSAIALQYFLLIIVCLLKYSMYLLVILFGLWWIWG